MNLRIVNLSLLAAISVPYAQAFAPNSLSRPSVVTPSLALQAEAGHKRRVARKVRSEELVRNNTMCTMRVCRVWRHWETDILPAQVIPLHRIASPTTATTTTTTTTTTITNYGHTHPHSCLSFHHGHPNYHRYHPNYRYHRYHCRHRPSDEWLEP